MKTRTKIQRAINQLQMLTDFGLGITQGTRKRQRARLMREEKMRLLASEERFESACEWLQNVDKTRAINPRHNSRLQKTI